MKTKLEKGEDIKYSCAGNLAQYKELKAASDAADKQAYADMINVCFIDSPRKVMAGIREKMASGEFSSFDTVSLTTALEDEKFPKDGEGVKVAAEAKKLLEVEIPLFELNKHLKDAKKDKEEGKTVSMGCIKAKQVVDKSAEALNADEKGKAAMAAYAEACPEK